MKPMITNDNGDGTAQVAMTLAEIAYATTEGDIKTLLADPNLATKGRWSLRWYGADDGNQAYIVQDDQAEQYCVAIRGSVTDPSKKAFWIDWFVEDFSIFKMEDWPYGGAPSGAKIAKGTFDGLKELIGLKNADGQTMADFIDSNITPGSSWPTGVVGHSLGGTLASALAPYLHQQFSPGQNLLDFWPVTFAGATAGNKLFAGWLESQFVASPGRYFNDIDIVPHCWGDLEWVADSFPSPGPKLSDSLAKLVRDLEEFLELLNDDYTQPGSGVPLTGTIQQKDNWFEEAGHQHAGKNYLALLGAPPVPVTRD